ncbi:MAG: hypothetical protein Q7T82_13185 [Armatimonadota bacterium]|nr:hypothetical protein [Armatimonadota bacterium]
MSLAVVVTLTVLAVMLSYIGVYAKVTKNGYYRAHLVAQLREARVQNVRLRADIQALSSPERLGQVAMESGMQVCSQVDYLEPGSQTMVVAEAGED